MTKFRFQIAVEYCDSIEEITTEVIDYTQQGAIRQLRKKFPTLLSITLVGIDTDYDQP